MSPTSSVINKQFSVSLHHEVGGETPYSSLSPHLRKHEGPLICSSFSCLYIIMFCTWKTGRGNELVGRATDSSGRQNAKHRGERETRVFLLPVSVTLLALHFRCHFPPAFSFPRHMCGLMCSPPQEKDYQQVL